eukprot:scaffold8304_cov160-Skeletonema_marinoi.AAC.1
MFNEIILFAAIAAFAMHHLLFCYLLKCLRTNQFSSDQPKLLTAIGATTAKPRANDILRIAASALAAESSLIFHAFFTSSFIELIDCTIYCPIIVC